MSENCLRIGRRAPQKRAEETRSQLLAAATDLFSSLGFEGVSVRTIETHAGVQRGLAAYHFDTKDTLWRGVVDSLFARFAERSARTAETIRDMSPEACLHAIVATFVRFNAETPAFNRLMMQEGKVQSWRMDYIVDAHISKIIAEAEALLGFKIDPHVYYVLVGAGALVFSMEHECERLFGINPSQEEFIRRHAQIVTDMVRRFGEDTNGS